MTSAANGSGFRDYQSSESVPVWGHYTQKRDCEGNRGLLSIRRVQQMQDVSDGRQQLNTEGYK